MDLTRPISDYMSPSPAILRTTDTVHDARRLFVDNHFRLVPVVGDEGRLEGVVSASDLVRNGLEDGQLLRDVLSGDVVTERKSTSVGNGARVLATCGVHNLVVVDDRARPVGVLSVIDVARAIADSELNEAATTLMSAELVTVDPGMWVSEARQILEDEGVTAALVVDNGDVVGTFSQLDLLRCEEQGDGDLETCRVDEVMDDSPCSVSSDARIADVAAAMSEEGLRRVLVYDSEEVVGIITATDLARYAGAVAEYTLSPDL